MQVPNEVRKSVIFICIKNREDPQKFSAIGTAFLVSIENKDLNRIYGYVVTAKHVIDGANTATDDGKIYLRVNKKDNSNTLVPINISDWKFHPSDSSHVDVAVLNLFLPVDVCDVLTIPIDMFTSDEIIAKESVGVGDEVFITGLFVNHVGRQRNLPIVRTGNIALMPEEPIHTSDLGDIDAYLIEARSIGGISGSPVFVYMGHLRNRNGNVQLGGQQQLFYFLGLMHGHWDVSEKKIDAIVEDDKKRNNVNMGIAIVVPATKIAEVINQPDFIKVRNEDTEKIKKERLSAAAIRADDHT